MDLWRAYIVVRVAGEGEPTTLFPGDKIGRDPECQLVIENPGIALLHLRVRLSEDGELYLRRRGENVPWPERKRLLRPGVPIPLLPGPGSLDLHVHSVHLPDNVLFLRVVETGQLIGSLAHHQWYSVVVGDHGLPVLVSGERSAAALTIRYPYHRRPILEAPNGPGGAFTPGGEWKVGDYTVRLVEVPREHVGTADTKQLGSPESAPETTTRSDRAAQTSSGMLRQEAPLMVQVVNTVAGVSVCVVRGPRRATLPSGQSALLAEVLAHSGPVGKQAIMQKLGWDLEKLRSEKGNLRRTVKSVGFSKNPLYRCDRNGWEHRQGSYLAAWPEVREAYERVEHLRQSESAE